MKKERFNKLLHNYSSSKDEIGALSKLASDYPYSQVLHFLLANASKREDIKTFKPRLKNAAFYSTDRSILKSLIEQNKVPGEPNQESTTHAFVPSKTSSLEETEALVNQVLESLAILQQTKKEAEKWLDDSTKKISKPIKKSKTEATKAPAKTEKTKKVKPKPSKTAVTKGSGRKRSSQSKIIDKFIKEEPSITKNSSSKANKNDMAKESYTMHDDLISESLAKIYVKQGKIDKAIDIYKKLIWKLPQKKALFAAQIENLKKK